MGLTDKLNDLTDLARETAVEHKDQVNEAVQKAGQLADERTGGRYHDQIAKAGAKAEAYLEDLESGETRESGGSGEARESGGSGEARESGESGESGGSGAARSHPEPPAGA